MITYIKVQNIVEKGYFGYKEQILYLLQCFHLLQTNQLFPFSGGGIIKWCSINGKSFLPRLRFTIAKENKENIIFII